MWVLSHSDTDHLNRHMVGCGCHEILIPCSYYNCPVLDHFPCDFYFSRWGWGWVHTGSLESKLRTTIVSDGTSSIYHQASIDFSSEDRSNMYDGMSKEFSWKKTYWSVHLIPLLQNWSLGRWILLLWLCLVVIDASPVTAPDTREVLDLQSACTSMDSLGSSEVARVICDASCCWYLYRISRRTSLQLFLLCTGLFKRYWLCTIRKEMKWTTIEKKTEIDTQESLFLLSTPISSSRICSESSTTQTSLIRKLVYLPDHHPEKNLDEYEEAILWLYPFCDRITSSAKRVHIRWITYLFVSAPHLPHSTVRFRLEQPKLVQKWYPSMQVRNAD